MLAPDISVTPVTPEKAAELMHAAIPEFDPSYFDDRYFSKGIDQLSPFALLARAGDTPAGYAIGYNRDFNGGPSLYLWLAGVATHHRRRGVFSALMAVFETEALARGHNLITVKTSEKFSGMIAALGNLGFAQHQNAEGDENALYFAKSLPPAHIATLDTTQATPQSHDIPQRS